MTTSTRKPRTRTKTAKPITGTTGQPPPPAPAVHVGYQPAGRDLYGRRAKTSYHLVANESIFLDSPPPLCGITRYPGEALCGYPGDWEHIPYGLFPPPVSCTRCTQLAARHGITTDHDDPAS